MEAAYDRSAEGLMKTLTSSSEKHGENSTVWLVIALMELSLTQVRRIS
jgi:hypothetical protein